MQHNGQKNSLYIPSVFRVNAKMIANVMTPRKLEDAAAETMLVGITALPTFRSDSTIELAAEPVDEVDLPY